MVFKKTLTNCFSSSRVLARNLHSRVEKTLTNMVNTLQAPTRNSGWTLIIRFIPGKTVG